jgi:putative ABC transport system substrate-binding protein
MIRRRFITLIGGAAAAWPLAARAQQPALPVVGLLGAPSAAPYAPFVAAVARGLQEVGLVEGRNVAIEQRWAEGKYDRLPAMAAELVARRVAVIVAIGGAPAALATKTATSTIPIVFNMTADPVQLGLVASFNRPGGNVTGVTMLGVELEAKRLETLRELVPASPLIAMLVNPSNAQSETQSHDVQAAAGGIRQQVVILSASTEFEIEAAFAALVKAQAGALLVGADVFFASQPDLFVALSARHATPAIYPWRSHVDAGGLMSYGASPLDAYRQAGAYGRPGSQGRETCRPAGVAADQVRAGDQSQDRQGARPRRAADLARARRRGDRMNRQCGPRRPGLRAPASATRERSIRATSPTR